MYSYDFKEMAKLMRREDWPEAGRRLAVTAKTLERAGAEAIALCCNTLHRVADEITRELSVSFIDITDATTQAAVQAGRSRALLLGTSFTMRQSFFRTRLASAGIETVTPTETGIVAMDQIIFGELSRGLVTEDARRVLDDIIGQAKIGGADCVILGCTELAMLAPQERDLVVLDITAVHVSEIVRFILDV